MISTEERRIIRGSFPDHYKIRFVGGMVFGKKKPSDRWQMLYDKDMLARHIAHIRNS